MENIHIQHMTESGLIAVSLGEEGIELCIEDINEINDLVKEIGLNNIANREDFE